MITNSFVIFKNWFVRLVDKQISDMKDLTKEMYFADNKLTTASEIEKLANDLLNETWRIDAYRFQTTSMFNLALLGWKFEFNTRKRAAGLCSKREKTIYISKWLLDQNLHKSLEFENTIRHEIAHALEFELRGESNHGRLWKFIARQVLCTAERCFTGEQISITATTKYTLICDNCGNKTPRHKAMTRHSACGNCCNEYNFGRYSDKYKMRVVQNY